MLKEKFLTGVIIPQRNLSTGECKALQELENNDNIMVKPADKGGGIVVMDKDKYMQESYRQVLDTEIHRQVEVNQVDGIKIWLKILIDHAFAIDIIDKDLHKFLLKQDSVTPLVYILPKIHKH